ncbi:MAG: carbon storage regulator [Planctomycetes bacterium HGW-Planctomycetes-2]|nr:MAG: carbon storage regulator [Planctomycetes bacterium HGW-Planctomycetes-2]
MLVLSRQRDETIMIGDDVEITVVDVRGDKVRLGISAPARIAVHRKEVYEAIRAENREASSAAQGDLASLTPPERAGSTPRAIVGLRAAAPRAGDAGAQRRRA